tara:strand:+ start:111657 stop:112676 length:1020 start_codon:yes stop_codon:yes gene_type:complete
MGRDGKKNVLDPNKRYIMSRQGDLIEVSASGDNVDDDGEFNQQVDNINSLVVSGDRGDLRHLETIIRNMSSVYSNAVLKEDVLHTDEANPTAEKYWYPHPRDSGKNTDNIGNDDSDFGQPRVINYLRIELPDHFESASDEYTFTLRAGHTGSSFPIVESLTYRPAEHGGRGAKELVMVVTDPTPYQYAYCKIDEGGYLPITKVAVSHSPVLVDRFLGADEGNRINELVGESYDLSVFIEGGIPSSERLLQFRVPQRLTLKANFEDCVGKCMTRPKSALGIEVYKGSIQLGILTINSNGAVTATYPETVFNVGERLVLKSTSIGDPQLSDVALTFVFKRG